jgi:hypothetical protein
VLTTARIAQLVGKRSLAGMRVRIKQMRRRCSRS